MATYGNARIVPKEFVSIVNAPCAIEHLCQDAARELIDREAVREFIKSYRHSTDVAFDMEKHLDEIPAASTWHRVDEPPKKAGEYIVAYHPCWWDDVKTQVTKVGIDSFRGKASWAKRKTQRVTHWMEKPEPPKEDA